MKINLTIQDERILRDPFVAPRYSDREPKRETFTLASIDGEMDRATLAATLRAIAEGIER